MGLGSPSLRAFAASRELRSGVQEVGCKKWGARSHEGENSRPFGILPHVMEFKVSRSRYHLLATRWDAL
jgi:hypothetical protein